MPDAASTLHWTATAHATHPEGAVVPDPTPADQLNAAAPQEKSA